MLDVIDKRWPWSFNFLNYVILYCAGSPQVGLKRKKKRSGKNFNIFSRVFWSTKKAFSNFLQSFQDFMTSLFEAADKKELGNEKTNLFERSVKACMMLAVVVLSIVVFKRSAAAKRGWLYHPNNRGLGSFVIFVDTYPMIMWGWISGHHSPW